MFSSGKNPSEAVGNRRVVFVEVIEARNLMAQNKNGTCDPYASIALLDLGGREIKNESYKTKQKNATLTPNWSEKIALGKFKLRLLSTIYSYIHFAYCHSHC